MPKFIDLTGRKIHDWTVITRVNLKKRKTHWLCRCSCGKDSCVLSSHLLGGFSKRCKNCHNKEAVSKRPIKHGNCKSKNSSEYYSWICMKNRCLNPKSENWKNYGGRGIDICPEWKNDFKCFLKDMGKKPLGYSIERIDNEKGYSKENCVWSNRQKQSENRRTVVKLVKNGITNTKTGWAKYFGIPYTSFDRLIKKYGWPLPDLGEKNAPS